MAAAGNVDDVVRLLTAVTDQARAAAHRRGYFAAMYRQMSVAVQRGIESGYFNDGPRMSRFTAIFANRYLHALDTFQGGAEPTRSWRASFSCCERRDRLILQQVVLGINAHVNLDLGVAAAEVAPGDEIHHLRGDFERINTIIGGLLDAVQEAIGAFSPLLDLLWRVTDRPGDEVLNFSFAVARDEAWRHAVVLAGLPPAERPGVIDSFDRAAALLARLVIEPGGILGRTVSIVKHTEDEDIRAVIDALASVEPRP
ncbi:MAG: DUF5995 family protein [Acidimicrobiales bacterium]